MEQLTFERLLDALRRQWWVIAQAIVIIGLAAGLYTARLPLRDYATQTSFLVRPEVTDAATGAINTGPGYYAGQLRLLLSDEVMQATGKAVGLTREQVKAAAIAWVDSNAGIITVRGTNADPTVAVKVANALVDEFVKNRQLSRNSNLESRRELLDQQLQTTSDSITEINGKIAAHAAGSENGTLQTQRDSLLAQYQTLFQEQQSVLTQIATQAQIIERLDTARDARRLPNPSVPTRAALGALLGAIIGAALAAVREATDARIRSSEQMGRIAEAPVLVELPVLHRRDSRGIAMVDRPEGAFAESTRSLQTTIRFMQQEGELRVLAITSAQAGDGKTTVASNLATSFALSGFQVALISGDLRRGTIDDRFPVDPQHMGLTDLLSARKREDHIRFKVETDGLPAHVVDVTSATDALQPTRTQGLQLLAAGSPTQQPAELLGSPQFADVISELRSAVDIVVIDCPPAIVADTLLLARVADSTVIVASVGRTQRRLLGDATDRLRAAQAQLLGVVANRVGANRRGYYGRYGYYNRYASYSGTYASKRDKRGRPAKAAKG